MKRLITYIIQKDEDGYYVADVPELPGCHTQAKSLDQLEKRIQEAVLLYFDEMNDDEVNGTLLKFVGISQTEVSV